MATSWILISALLIFSLLAIAWVAFPLRSLKMGFIVLPLGFLFIFLGYFNWGGFSLWQDYERKKEAQAILKSMKSPDELINKLKARLNQTPKSAKGWYLLGRLYSSQNQQEKALEAFKKAQALEPRNERYQVNYAHSLWRANHQQFTPQVVQLFEKVIEKNPEQKDALAMLAMNAYVHKKYERAITYWQKVLALLPPQSEEAKAIHQAIIKAQAQKKNLP